MNKELIKLMGLLIEDNLSIRGREDLYKEIILIIQENKEQNEKIQNAIDYIKGAYEMCVYTKSLTFDGENLEDLLEILERGE